jgi:hypothetical protein
MKKFEMWKGNKECNISEIFTNSERSEIQDAAEKRAIIKQLINSNTVFTKL